MTVRDARPGDLEAVVAIYNASIAGRFATADLEPVDPGSRRAWFEAHGPGFLPLLVAEDAEGTMLGWGSLSVFYGRAAYRHTAEISVYVAPEARRRGVGSVLVRALVARCGPCEIRTLLAYIFGHNAPSIALFERFGFAPWGRLPNVADMDGVERDLVIYGLRVSGERG